MQGKTTAQLRGSWHNFSKYRPLIRELVTRDLKVKYRRSFLGYVWSILNPLLMMLLQTLVFSYMFRFQIENFPLYLICGNTLFNFFNESTNMGMGSVLGNSSLIKKVYVPKFIFPISRVVSSFVNLLFSLAAIILVMLITRSPFHLTILLVWAPLVLLFLFTCGIALLLSALAVYFRDLQYLYGIVTMAWMYATPLFYPISALPPFMVAIVKLNPLYHYINCMRCLVMYGTVPGPNTWFACIVCAVGMMVVGLAAFRKLPIIQVDNVSMRFNLAQEKTETLKEYTVKLLKHQLFFNEFYALQDVSFSIEPGESVALIGRNGSGKSTMLKLIAGVMYPSKGSVRVNGEIAPLIELGAGFDMELTARENVYLNGAVLGHDRAYMDEHFKNIIDFAELWDFVDVPVKNYSSGMIARLGFSIATEVRADILACDEILSVGDFMFQQKCHDRMEQMLSGGTTLLFVSHDINQVKQLCKRAIWIDHGHLRGDGPSAEVCDAYVAAMQRGE